MSTAKSRLTSSAGDVQKTSSSSEPASRSGTSTLSDYGVVTATGSASMNVSAGGSGTRRVGTGMSSDAGKRTVNFVVDVNPARGAVQKAVTLAVRPFVLEQEARQERANRSIAIGHLPQRDTTSGA